MRRIPRGEHPALVRMPQLVRQRRKTLEFGGHLSDLPQLQPAEAEQRARIQRDVAPAEPFAGLCRLPGEGDSLFRAVRERWVGVQQHGDGGELVVCLAHDGHGLTGERYPSILICIQDHLRREPRHHPRAQWRPRVAQHFQHARKPGERYLVRVLVPVRQPLVRAIAQRGTREMFGGADLLRQRRRLSELFLGEQKVAAVPLCPRDHHHQLTPLYLIRAGTMLQ